MSAENPKSSGLGRRENLASVAVFAAALFLCMIGTKTWVSYSGNEASRLAMVESLAERSTFRIDDSLYNWTSDKVRIDGHYYCDKPPLMSLYSAGVAKVLGVVYGLHPDSNKSLWIYWITVLTVGLCASWLALAIFLDTFKLWRITELRNRILLTISAWMGTLVYTYSVTYTNHVPAAAFLYAGFSAMARALHSDERDFYRGAMICGFFTGMAWAMDYVAGGAFLVVFGALIVIEGHKRDRPLAIGRYLLMASLPIIATLAVNYIMAGYFRPLYLVPGAYDYPGSKFPASGPAGTYRPNDLLTYAFHAVIGQRGVFSYSPVLVIALVAMIGYTRRGERWNVLMARASLIGAVLVFLIYIFFTNNYGGWAYGFRYFAPVMPIMAFFLGRQWAKYPTWRRKALIPVAVVSIFLSVLGAFNPWPVVNEGESPAQREKTPFDRPLMANIYVLQATIDMDSSLKSPIVRWKMNGSEPEAALYLASSFLNRNDFDRAESLLNKAQKLDPNNVKVRILLEAMRRERR